MTRAADATIEPLMGDSSEWLLNHRMITSRVACNHFNSPIHHFFPLIHFFFIIVAMTAKGWERYSYVKRFFIDDE